MAEFQIEIAGCVFGINSLFASTRDYCRAYLTGNAPEHTIRVTQENLDFEQAYFREEALREGMRPRTFTDPFLERAAIQRQVADLLLAHDTLLLHGSAVAVDGQGYLFTAKCGTGKSTHTRLWCQVFGSRAVMVNDDKPFLKKSGADFLLCGAPWSGKHGLDTNITVPLKGICILERGAENRIQSISPQEAGPMLFSQTLVPLDPALLPLHERLMTDLLDSVPLWSMKCSKTPDAAYTAWHFMH